MATLEELEDAYALTLQAEKDMLVATEDAMNAFVADLDAILATVPDNAPIMPPKTLVDRLRGHIAGMMQMELDALKLQYNPPEPLPVP